MKKICICILLAAIALACGKSDEEATAGSPKPAVARPKTLEEAAKKEKMDVGDGQVNISDPGGTLSVASKGSAKLPKGFPKDVPIYPGGRIAVSSSEGDSFTISMEITANVDTVAKEYHSLMTAQGWKRNVHHNAGGIHMMGYDKGDRHVNLNVFGDREKKGTTQVALIVTSKK